MAGRPTIEDLARAARVSTATVDRVLNGRAHVRAATARRVAEAAQQIGYHAHGLIAHRLTPDLPAIRLGFVLHKERQEFYRNFARELDAAVAARTDARVRAVIRYSPSQSPDDFAKEIAALEGDVDAIASSAVSHQSLSRVVQDLKSRGTPVFAVLTEFAQGLRAHYVGLNNIKVGRLAGWLLATAAREPGKLALFVGGNRWHGHALRETGFRSYLRENAPGFQVLDTLVNLETRQLTYEATLDLLHRHPDLRGIFVAGGGMEGAIAAVRETRKPGKLAMVVPELTAESRAALSDGYVSMAIATPLDTLCRDLVGLMVSSVQDGIAPVPGQHFLDPRIYLPESL